MPPHYFWNLVLVGNSALLACASIFLVYSIGMLILEFDWKLFLLSLVIWLALLGSEFIINALSGK